METMVTRFKHPIPKLQAQDLFDALPDMAFRLGPDGTILELNAAASAADDGGAALVGQKLQDTRLRHVADSFCLALERIVARRDAVALEYSLARGDGEAHEEARLVPLPAGAVLVLIRDVTERKLTENALRESDAKFRNLADNVSDAFWIRSADMREVHFVSPGFERIWGRPMRTLYGSPEKWVEYIVPEDRERVVNVFSGLSAGLRSLDVEYRITRPDGEIRWIRARGFQVRDAQDRLVRNTGIITDITPRKNAEEQLEATQAQLMQASRRAGMAEIATNVLHNVGNILNSVNVSASMVRGTVRKSRARGLSRAVDLLREHEGALAGFLTQDERGRQLPAYLGAITKALHEEQQAMIEELDHLTRSIDHITEVVTAQQSRARSGGVFETAQMGALVEEALRMSADALLRAGVAVVRDFAPVPAARLDRALVLQVLVNLIGNARTALERAPEALRRITLRVGLAEGERLRVAVQDEGEGIAPETMARLFTHGFTTRKHGHGFGLHSCKQAAAEMGGSLAAHSNGPGLGATFTLELPIERMETTA
ncbi:MAG: sensor signal transduction histidine kinase [Ramlibacter sp.]|nr:sensor signal transduction histidine kinase [Ramlibacter sp.]